MTQTYDALIVGGGHNGLVCGSYLARAGKRVCVLERRHQVGGAAVSEEVWPGYRVSVASYTMALLQPRIMLDLELARHGLEVIKPTPMTHFFDHDRYLVFSDSLEQVQRDIARYSPADATAYPLFREHMQKLGRVVMRLLWEIPPDPGASDLKSRMSLLKFAWRYRNLGAAFHDLYDALTLSAEEFLRRWFESEHVITALGFYASCGGATTTIGEPGSAYILLRGYVRDHATQAGPAGFIRGGMGRISDAIASAGREAGMEIRCDSAVARIITRQGRACGVELESGETLPARTVVSNVPSKTLFQKLLSPQDSTAGFLRRIGQIRDRSTAFKVHIALNRLPSFTGFDGETAGFAYPAQLRIGPSLNALEASYARAKRGEITQEPALVVTTPSVLDDSVAPPGKHLMVVFGQHIPYRVAGREWTAEHRAHFIDSVLDTLSRYAPDIRDCVQDVDLLTPADLERVFGLPGGHVHHGELSADQAFFKRPVPGAADYRTPIKGLFQCGASVHPGGGVTGVPGHNAAKVILQAMR